MKIISTLVSLCLISVPIQVYALDIEDLILPGSTFGNGWELTQPNIISSSAAGPNYINRSLPNSPVIMINIIRFPSPEAAQIMIQQKFSTEAAQREVQRLPDGSFERVRSGLRKRYVIIQQFWLIVAQFDQRDDRSIFIEKYTKHIKDSM